MSNENTHTAEAGVCEHGKLVGLDNPQDPRECQDCDWCPRCEAVRKYDGETCATCGQVWGEFTD
jgi:hypothetical protein